MEDGSPHLSAARMVVMWPLKELLLGKCGGLNKEVAL
jgi:hypothetical protein